MKWVLIKEFHINTAMIQAFYWNDFELVIALEGRPELVCPDPDRELYLKLCRQQGIRPYEEE